MLGQAGLSAQEIADDADTLVHVFKVMQFEQYGPLPPSHQEEKERRPPSGTHVLIGGFTISGISQSRPVLAVPFDGGWRQSVARLPPRLHRPPCPVCPPFSDDEDDNEPQPKSFGVWMYVGVSGSTQGFAVPPSRPPSAGTPISPRSQPYAPQAQLAYHSGGGAQRQQTPMSTLSTISPRQPPPGGFINSPRRQTPADVFATFTEGGGSPRQLASGGGAGSGGGDDRPLPPVPPEAGLSSTLPPLPPPLVSCVPPGAVPVCAVVAVAAAAALCSYLAICLGGLWWPLKNRAFFQSVSYPATTLQPHSIISTLLCSLIHSALLSLRL